MIRAPMSAAANQINRLFVEGTVSGLTDGELLDRFVDGRDEAAFAALVERHGPMVLATCRAVVRDHGTAEDTFQATFLVLVCKARTIRGREAIGGGCIVSLAGSLSISVWRPRVSETANG